MSVSTNERADLMAMVLLAGFAVLMVQRRVLTWVNLLAVYVGWRLIYAFSSVAISIRWARDTSLSLFDLFATNFFSTETLWTLINPLHVHQSYALYASTTQRSGFYSEFIGNVTDLFGRLTVLPQMDIVVSRWPDYEPARWNELWTLLLSAFPSFGQEKSLIFSDLVVWELGLRGRESIGRPMITAEGELYVIGGYLAVFLVPSVCYLLLHWGYRFTARLTGSRAAAILLTSQFFINTVFSTTVLSMMTGTIREPLQLLLVLGCIVFVIKQVIRALPVAKVAT